MAPSANALFLAAMDLPVDERASLAVKLLGTVDEAAPDDSLDTYEAWCRKVEDRLAALLSGEDRGEDWDATHAELVAEFGRG
ncbi:MAG: addiction module protein [Ilumatobacteraceae bacterium]